MQVWADPARRYGAEAGVDPVFLLAVTLMESRKARSFYKVAGEGGFAGIEKFESYSWFHGTWVGPEEGPSLGITNMKPGVFAKVANAYPGQFKGTTWSDLAGDDGLSIKATAYYLKYLESKYSHVASPRVSQAASHRVSENEKAYGIYNGGEHEFTSGAVPRGYFGPVVSGNIAKMNSYLSQAQRLILGPGVDLN